MDELITAAGGAGALAYTAEKLFGATLATMGDDINKAYQKGRDKIIEKATKKVPNPDDGKSPNLRVARDVIWNGAITEDEVCAEYFGGLLAASRSEDGKDDSALIYVDCIKALSSKQLHLHYVVYWCMQQHLLAKGKPFNPAHQNDLGNMSVHFFSGDLQRMGLLPSSDLIVLHRQGLISGYRIEQSASPRGIDFSFASIQPTSFGILLYAAAMNSLDRWRNYGSASFGSTDVMLPSVSRESLLELGQFLDSVQITSVGHDPSDPQLPNP